MRRLRVLSWAVPRRPMSATTAGARVALGIALAVGGCTTGAPVMGPPAPSVTRESAPAAIDGDAVDTAVAVADRYREASREIGRLDSGGTIGDVRWESDPPAVRFTRLGVEHRFDLERRELVEVVAEPDEAESDARRPQRPRGPGRGRQRKSETSPDGRWVAVCSDYNVVLEAAEEGAADGDHASGSPMTADGGGEGSGTGETAEGGDRASRAVTTAGNARLRYGMASWVYGEELDQTTAMWWSPDSRTLAFYEFDERDVPQYYLLGGLTDLRTRVETEGYPKPGDPNPVAALLLYDLETGDTRRVDTGETGDGEWYVYNVRFDPSGEELLFSRTNRHQNVLEVMAANVKTGASRLVVRETQATWQSNRPMMRFLADGERFIWETEASGFRHYELRHLDGRRLATLTRGAAPVTGVTRVDEEAGILYYTAYIASEPLNEHFFRVDLDGTDGRRLTREAASHRVRLSPDNRWFVTRYETITDPPTTAVYDTFGARLGTLAESEPDRVVALGYPEPELFSCPAADGETTLYGWLYKPPGFDPSKRYPLVIDVYGGPESKGVRNRYRVGHPATAFGFLVAKVDNRGTGGRGREFLGAVYEQLGTVDLDDQVAGVRHLLQRPYVDPARVAIYGHSYGGYMAALAILRYPDVFSVAVAGAPVTDWRNYDTIYTERYMRTPDENESGYDAGSCLTYADQLEGDLLILHGMIDDNVHPTNAWQLVNALQDADKSFEIMFYPNSGHGLRSDAATRRWEFLVRHLSP